MIPKPSIVPFRKLSHVGPQRGGLTEGVEVVAVGAWPELIRICKENKNYQIGSEANENSQSPGA